MKIIWYFRFLASTMAWQFIKKFGIWQLEWKEKGAVDIGTKWGDFFYLTVTELRFIIKGININKKILKSNLDSWRHIGKIKLRCIHKKVADEKLLQELCNWKKGKVLIIKYNSKASHICITHCQHIWCQIWWEQQSSGSKLYLHNKRRGQLITGIHWTGSLRLAVYRISQLLCGACQKSQNRHELL